MNYVMTAETLQKKLQTERIAVIDVRSNLQNPDLGHDAYNEGHIPGAFFLHLEKDLSGEVKKHGGNHPLPDVGQLAAKFGAIGIDHRTTVVFYDDGNDMFAARAWWLLYYMGHEEAYVLDGGFNAWKEAGCEITKAVPKRRSKQFMPRLRREDVVDIDGVKHRDPKRSVLIDSRAKERYLGKTEPLYDKSGHIPGAKNYFYKDVFDADGKWKSDILLQERFEQLRNADEIIVSCGSGISACPNIIALKMAGYENVKLYPGSFSDWISYEENPVETSEE